MLEINMDELTEEFHRRADESKHLLDSMLDVISEGCVPTEDNVDKLILSVDALRENYLSIYRLACEQLTEDELPGEGMPAQVYADALANSISLRYKRLMAAAEKVTESFAAVKSTVSVYAQALEPYQTAALEFLKCLNAGEPLESEHIRNEIAGPQAFLNAISCSDFTSEDTIEVLEQASEYYPVRVLTGIACGKYFISTGPADRLTEKEPDSASGDTSVNSGVFAALDGTADSQDGDMPPNSDVSSDAVPDTSRPEADGTPAGDSAFVQKLRQYSALLSADENLGIFSKGIHPGEKKKITSSIFVSDMRTGIEPVEKAEKIILKELDSRNCTAGILLTAAKGIPQKLADSVLSHLYKKGYLRKYSLFPGGEFFCASARLIKAMSFKECSKFAGIRRRTSEAWGERIEDRAASAAARIAYVNVNVLIARRFIERKTSEYTEKMCIFTDAFFSLIKINAFPEKCELAVGAFWDNTAECDAFLETATVHLNACEGIAQIYAAGINHEKARAFAKALLEETGHDFSGANVWLYSLSDNSYCRYPSMEPVDVEALYADSDKSEAEPVSEPSAPEADDSADLTEPPLPEADDSTTLTEPPVPEADDSTTLTEPPVPEADDSTDLTEPPQQTTEKRAPAAEVNAALKATALDTTAQTDMDVLYGLLAERRFYCAAAYAKSCSLAGRLNELLYNQLAYALNDPLARCIYSTENVFRLIPEGGVFEETLTVSTAIRMFFSSQVRYDYNIKSFYGGIKNYEVLNTFPTLSQVVYSLLEFKNEYNRGIDTYAGYRTKSRTALNRDIARLRSEAGSFYDNFVVGKKKENASQKRFIETKKLMFSVSSDIGQYIKSIIDEDLEMLPLMTDFLQENFFAEEDEISETTINAEKLWKYIVVFWEKAGGNMVYRRHEDLMSHLRSNITNTTVKAVQLMARWYVLAEQLNKRTDDTGTTAYERLQKPLRENISAAIAELKEGISASASHMERVAGLNVILTTLQEILQCMDGTIDEHAWKYFYAEFLLTDDIMLDENFLPDLNTHSSEMKSMQPANRIISHVRKISRHKATYRERLSEILEDRGDDYGAARLIIDYLAYNEDSENREELAALLETVDSGEEYAKETADLRKADFIGELELAQSYGQIDNSSEDKKEKILQIVDEWYGWAVNSANYGFLNKVMDAYLEEIRETAKSREADLLEQLETFKETSVSVLTGEVKEKRIARIEAMIQEQNYTVAEDLLARATRIDEDGEDAVEEDFLKEFLDNYDDYYQPVATHKSNFASLVNSRTRNKEERGAKKLADNWLPGGSKLGRERLSTLLTCLGFSVDSVKEQNEIVKFENFIVQTKAVQGSGISHYTHPIAAFGSGAVQDGFRVVCINGGYDADGLIDLMKQIVNAKHTLILLDHALSKGERRRLARKTKNSLGDKFSGVVDRTVMMFLIRNFDETKINRMLISLIVPFGYYQPYVWESVNVMPPEIFMGRKYELERIKSATGANIVYGGRQLGKSALLKKAKDDINWDENGNRAVYVEIKGLNYQEAAKKIGHELYDQDILEDDIETTDWDELARAIKRRLQSGNKRIPYLLLLLDEADVFIESCEAVNYKPFDSLKEVQSIGPGRFKFVIAGLHNIVRFKREAALSNNSVLTHLEAMTVKPFHFSEARELMEVPVHYLGLRFPKEKESLVTLILATTNYFPGLIQLYCAKLLDAMRKKDYAGYNEVDSPVYEVSEEHIKKVLADPEFMQQIREKYIITLKLDEDNYYYLIALVMAYLYHTNGYSKGYAADDIKKAGIDLEITKIAALDLKKLAAFMEELRELNVLRSTDDNHYLFTRFTFFQMMGTNTEVADKLMDYMEG